MSIPNDNKNMSTRNPSIKEIINLSGDANQYNPNLIVFFENETYDAISIEDRFEYYGGNISGRWNGDFDSFSGFYGIMPLAENASAFEDEIDLSIECHIEPNGIVQAQMNYASIQSGALNLSGYIGGYNGLNDASIALLDTGIDDTHEYLSGKVEENINFIDPGGDTNDENGHGTFLSSVISGNGTYPFNSTNPIDLHISKKFKHSEIHGTGSESGNYSIKLATFNVSRANSVIFFNSSWSLIDEGVDEVWFELWSDGELINYTFNELEDVNRVFTYQVPEENLGLYDLKVKYHKILNKNPSFSVDCVGEFFPEFYVSNYLYFSGIANNTKLLNYKVLNETAQGKMSDIISALSAVIQNRTIHKIVSVCLSLGTYETEINALNQVIDEVTENGILVVIAAGNYGIDDFETLNSLAQNNNAIVVGSINDRDQVTSFSSMGKKIGDSIIKPDIVAPGGSKLDQSRTIFSADANTNLLTSNYGTSISAAIVSAAINILIEAKWDDWAIWDGSNIAERIKIIKNALFMTATETNQNREDDPNTEIIESQNRFSPPLYLEAINLTSRAGLKDEHEGYGRLNIDAAVDSLIKTISPGLEYYDFLSSSSENPLGTHAFARQVQLVENRQYLFNLTDVEEGAVFDIYLYSNQSTQYGEPVLLESSRKSFRVYNYLYFTPEKNETNPYIVIKAINGEGNFTLNISEVNNSFDPSLKIPEITYNGKSKNTTVLSLSEREGDEPKKNITLDRYKFFIEYLDNDSANVPPQGVYVCIPSLSKNFSMSQSNVADQNYTDGAIFESEEIELPINQTYNYYFYVRDGEREDYFPSESTYLTIDISNPQVIKKFQYKHHFNDGLDNWTIVGPGWDILQQNNQNDDRSVLYMNNWSAVYFGTYHNYPTNYTYQPTVIGEYSNGSFISPYFDLTNLESNVNPILEFGCRISINDGDYVDLLINVNGSGWETPPLKTYTNLESDWILEKINLSEYKGNYVKLKYEADLDDSPDLINYKGFIIDYISINNFTNSNSPHIYFNISENVQYSSDLKYQKIKFSLDYFDTDNNYPEFVFLEIDNKNYSMINSFGDWNASSILSNDMGICFTKSLTLEDVSNRSFRFFISDGKNINSSQVYNKDNSLISFSIPNSLSYNIYQKTTPIGYLFNETLDNFYVAGTPVQKENSSWLQNDNTWHTIRKLYRNYLYGGRANLFNSQERGYGRNWEAELITKPIEIVSNKKVFLQFNYEIDLEFQGENGGDMGVVSLSNDYGETWSILKTYDSNENTEEKIDISEKVGNVVMIKFTLKTDDNLGAPPGFGWLLSEIYVGYDRDKDNIDPIISAINPSEGERISSLTNVQINLTDNIEIDLSELIILIDGTFYSPENLNYNNETGLLDFDWNTLDYNDGKHSIKIIAFDANGNSAELELTLIVDNMLIKFLRWSPWLIMGILILISIFSAYIYINHNDISLVDKVKGIYKSRSSNFDGDEDKVIKKIKKLESSHLDHPLTLYCKYCDSWFYSNNFDIICPSCGRDQIYAAYKCLSCGRWYFKDEPGEYYCKTCDGVKLIRRDKEEVQEIIGKEKRKVLQEFEGEKAEKHIV
jgi:hypothetical protein